jgi:hypothetical protein
MLVADVLPLAQAHGSIAGDADARFVSQRLAKENPHRSYKCGKTLLLKLWTFWKMPE